MPIQSELIHEWCTNDFTNAFFKSVSLTDSLGFSVSGSWKDDSGQESSVTMDYQVNLRPETIIVGARDLSLHAPGINTSLKVQNSHLAVTELLNRIVVLKELVRLERPSQLPVNNTFVEVNYDFSRDKDFSDKANLADNINTYAKFLYSRSGLASRGVKIEDINLIIGCDPVIYRILESSRIALMLLGKEPPFDEWEIVATYDKRMENMIVFTFDIPSKNDEGLPTFYNFGYHAFYKGNVYLGEEAKMFPIDGIHTYAASQDKIVIQPRSTFVNTMPILGVFNVSNVDAYY